MKKKLVSIILSTTMCLSMVVPTGAASFDLAEGMEDAVLVQNTDVSFAVEEGIRAEADIFSDGMTEEAPAEIPDEVPGEELPDTEAEDPFVEEVPEELPEEPVVEDGFTAGIAEETKDVTTEGATIVSAEDWEQEGEKFRLRKASAKTAEADAAAAEMAVVESEEGEAAFLSEVGDVQSTEIKQEVPVTEEEEAPEAEAPAGYYSEEDGILHIATEYKGSTHAGYYLFDEDGYLVTGKKVIKAGSFGASSDMEVYFTDVTNAVVYPEFAGEKVNPCSSNLGQQILNGWAWTGSTFRFYDEKGKYMTVTQLDEIGRQTGTYTGYYKAGSDYYCLEADGTPRTGEITLTVGSSSAKYYFQPAAGANDIPGKMYYKGWLKVKGQKGDRWVYYNQGVTKPADIGKLLVRGTTATRLDTKTMGNYTYLIDKKGYILKSTMVKAANGAYYCTDSRGVIYKDKLVKYKNYRYYFAADGKRVTWTKSWHKCPGASNRFYYFGSSAGRVEEKKGWQKVLTSKGNFYGWFYFNTAGNHYMNKLTSAGYYFTSTGRLASGTQDINGKKYLFAASDEKTHRGKMYKNTLIHYKNRWFYADAKGVLKESGWQKVDKDYYYFNNYKAVTKKFMKKDGVNGYLDANGKYTTGWVIVSNASNRVRYINPDGDGFMENGSKWIDGLLYYFDKNGYRINDVTNLYPGPYYVAVDRKNGVMTIYNRDKTVPVKSIRVSVGLPGTPTPTGTYTMSRSLRWQPLMGPSWGQYGTHVDGAGQGGIFVHSVSGGHQSIWSLPAGEYNKLGNPASHGCIRVCVADAKWVFDHCNGATIRIFDGTYNSNESMKGPLGRRPLKPLRAPYNFDPTDPEV